VAILCTSDHEGFPNTFLEALSAGTPVVTRRGVDPDSFIERNGLGRVADNEGLVQGLRDIWTLDLSDYEDLGRRCRAYVETNHSPETIAERLTAEIRALRPAANAA
jgi:glycosyltransferase involved in cell wall biosynthesis